jgi:prevent-host-death family protein
MDKSAIRRPPDLEGMTSIMVIETLPLATVKAKLSNLVDQVEETHERFMITRNGKPAALLISPADLESLEETLDIRSDPAAMRRIRRAEKEIERGEVLDEQQLRDLLTERARGGGS